MKKLNSLILIFILFFPLFASAENICSTVVYFDYQIDASGSPVSCSGSAPTTGPTLSDGCTATLIEWGNCIAAYNQCCETTQLLYDQHNNSTYGMEIITGVQMGQEAQAAGLACEAWLASAPGIACDTGYTKIGTAKDCVYDFKMGPDNLTMDVAVGYVKYSVCSKTGSGTMTPLSNLGGSGGSGGLTEAQTANAVKTGVADVKTGLTTLDTQLQMINGVLTNYATLYGTNSNITNQSLSSINSKTGDANTQLQMINGVLTNIDTGVSGVNTGLQGLGSKLDGISGILSSIDGKTSSGGSGGLTQAQTAAAVKDGLDGAVGVTPSGLGMGSYTKPGAYTNSEFSSFGDFNFGSRINTFVADVKTAPLFSSFTLVGLADTPGGSSSMPVSFGSFGSVNFDLATYAGTYNYIKGFLLLLGSYLAVRIVVLKR